MSISYEEALATLQAMFGEPWTRDSLDTVLRHYGGHMENTVECILGNSGKDPLVVLENLKNGGNNNSATNLDEELARQLSSRALPGVTPASTSSSSSNQQQQTGRGTPTTLPDDFLRVRTSTSQSTLDQDEALARMLQDELFSEELRRNPDFAHLAGGRRPGHTNGQHVQQQRQQQQQPQSMNRASFTARGHQPMPMPNIMEKLSEMGTSAKFKLSQMAEQFKQNTNRIVNNAQGGAAGGNADSPRNEMRGLLDRDDNYDAYELASRKDL